VEAQSKAVEKLASSFKNLTIMKKGNVDIISNGIQTIENEMTGCFKRCGGIGDILTGTLGTFVFWTNAQSSANQTELPPNLLACYAASALVKESSRRAFKKHHRSLLAVDIIEEIAESFYQLYDKDNY
jgi:ATP-dependent NAD(P)H-hydrate dehydratase